MKKVDQIKERVSAELYIEEEEWSDFTNQYGSGYEVTIRRPLLSPQDVLDVAERNGFDILDVVVKQLNWQDISIKIYK